MTRPYRPATLASDLATWTHHELRAEIERLRELFRIDGEQHVIHVREIEARHELRHKHYCAEIERLRAALQWIADRCPATAEHTLAHEMADAAVAALGKHHD